MLQHFVNTRISTNSSSINTLHIMWLHPVISLPGKPVAVTHSSGKGAGRTRPGTDVEYERAHWQRKRESARGRGNNEMRRKPMEACPMEEEDTEEDVASSDDLPRPVASSDDLPRPVAARQEFFSMAEIASCSYEARQVQIIHNEIVHMANRKGVIFFCVFTLMMGIFETTVYILPCCICIFLSMGCGLK